MLHRPVIITAMLLLFAGANSLSAVCATLELKPDHAQTEANSAAKAAGSPKSEQPEHASNQSRKNGQAEKPDSDDGEADLGQPPSPVLERQVRTAPVHPTDHRGCAMNTRIEAIQSAKPQLLKPNQSIPAEPQACIAGFPRSTNAPPTQ